MKNKMIALLTIMLVGGVSLVANTTATAASKNGIFEVKLERRQARIEAKLEIIRQKAGEEVKNKVAAKIKVKEEKIAKEKADVVAKKAAEEKAVEEAKATEQAAAPSTDATTSASQSGRERGQRNREYGQRLSDPNLTQAERQEIIQNKKDYNRNHR